MYFIVKMKTDASFITKNTDIERIEKIAAGQALVGFFIDYLETWSRRELTELLSKNPGLCANLGKNQYRVGRFKIVRLSNGMWQVLAYGNESEGDFYDRASAVFYCMYMGGSNVARAINIKDLDAQVCKLIVDLERYEYTYNRSCKKKDWFRADLAKTRIRETKISLNYAQEELKKTLSAAKYNKVWDRKP
jgi:hypothetical protein